MIKSPEWDQIPAVNTLPQVQQNPQVKSHFTQHNNPYHRNNILNLGRGRAANSTLLFTSGIYWYWLAACKIRIYTVFTIFVGPADFKKKV